MNSHGKGSDRAATLYRALLTLKTPEECYAFFEDLCTVSEQMAMEQRLEVAMLLDQGSIYSDVLEKTGDCRPQPCHPGDIRRGAVLSAAR